jgi:hypothetical protein
MITNKISPSLSSESHSSCAEFSSSSSSSSCAEFSSADPVFLHKQFVLLGKERNKITYKLLSLLPKINELKIYEAHGYATIFEYAGKLAGLSNSVVRKALNLEEKLKDKPYLRKTVETQGVHKVALVAGIATVENEKMFAEKVENMSKLALQEYSKEVRGKVQTSWNIEMDEEMMVMFLKLKKVVGEELSNKEAMRRMLKKMAESELDNRASKAMMAKKQKSQTQAKSQKLFPGDKHGASFASEVLLSKLYKNNLINKISESLSQATNNAKRKLENFCQSESDVAEINDNLIKKIHSKIHKQTIKITRYISVSKRRQVLTPTNGKCAHPNCPNPAQVFHHQLRFSQTKSHDSLIPLCKIHHEFAHNGITENQTNADVLYKKYRQQALL